MDVQYFHQKVTHDNPFDFVSKRRFTAAVEVPNIKNLLETITSVGKSLSLSVGIAYVHPKDQYKKTVGRALAKERMLPLEFKMRMAMILPRVDNIEEYVYDVALISDNILIELRYTEHYFRPILRSVSIL